MYDKKDFEVTKNMILDMMHNPQTTNQLVEILNAGDPLVTVPKAAVTVNDQLKQAYKQRGKQLSLENTIAASIMIGTELAELGSASGAFEVTEREAPAIMEKSTQAILKSGIKDGTVDPMELQELANDGMPEGMRKAGLSNESTPNEKDEMVEMEQYANRRVAQDRAKRPQQEGGMLNGKL